MNSRGSRWDRCLSKYLWVNSIGLGIGLIGAVLVFYYGVPDIIEPGKIFVEKDLTDEESLQKAHQERLGRRGIALIGFSFGMQILADIMNSVGKKRQKTRRAAT